MRKTNPIVFELAASNTWHPARLFSVVRVGADEEQEPRTISALIATMQAVRPFARAICARMGAPAGTFEGYLEVQYESGDTEVIQVDRRKLTKVALRHLSWAEVAHEARMLTTHGGIDDALQAWILAEFLRFLDHPRSGAAEFIDMGRHWVTVRDAVTQGTLRAGDAKAQTVTDTWVSLCRHLALRLTAELGVEVKHVLARKFQSDPAMGAAAVAERLATDGSFEAVLRIPETAGDLTVIADVRTNKVHCRTTIAAPDEGTQARRVSWLTKQLADAPGRVQVEAVFAERGNETCEFLDTVRTTPKSLIDGRTSPIVSFTLEQTFPMGNKRSGTAASFIASVTTATDAFYGAVMQPLREWVPAAPKQAGLDPTETAE